MDFIATYWWVWLIGLLAVLAAAGVLSVLNLIGFVRDTHAIAGKVRTALNVPEQERKQHLTHLGIEVATEKMKSRVVQSITLGVLWVVGGGFGILLLLAIIRYVFVYMQNT